MAPCVSWTASSSLPLWVPSEGLPCGVRCRPPQYVAYPLPPSLQDLFLDRSLFSSLLQIFICNFVWPAYPENHSETGVDESLNLLHAGDCGSPCLGSIE